MQIWQDEDEFTQEKNGGCCGLSAVDDARRVADRLEIPYYVMNFKQEFKKNVMDYFTAEYLKGEELCNTPCTPGGCYDRLKDCSGKILLVGVGHERNTYIHSVEEVLNVPNRLSDKPMELKIAMPDGSLRKVYVRRHYNATQPHISEDFVKLNQAFLECGAAEQVKFGDADCLLCDAKRIFEVVRHVLAPNPECIVTSESIATERWRDIAF
jgi:aminoglycoside 3-N-acetyltransferase